MKREILQQLQAARAEKRATALVTDLSGGEQALVIDDEQHGSLRLDDATLTAVQSAMAANKSGRLTPDPAGSGRQLFLQVFAPAHRLIVVGAVHIAQSLIPMAQLAGFEVTLIDPRRAWANDHRFPEVTLRQDWPEDALTALRLDRHCAVVALTHDPKLDDPALDVALRSASFYIGALGSRRSHAKRLARLGELGHEADALARIHGPVGLDIGAKSPAEIAVSILAEIIAIQRKSKLVKGTAAGQAPKIAGLLLAAGQSRRMGARNKLLEELDGLPLLSHAAAGLKASRADPLLAVTGHDYEAVEALLENEGMPYVHNPAFASGLASSLKRGLAALPRDIDGVVVCLGDMPRISPTVIDDLIAAFSPRAGRAICLPCYRGQPGNPMLFASRFIPELMTLSGDVGARGLVSAHPALVCDVPVEDPAVLSDADTPEDLTRLRHS